MHKSISLKVKQVRVKSEYKFKNILIQVKIIDGFKYIVILFTTIKGMPLCGLRNIKFTRYLV